jgi:hypothetical protein
MKAKVVEDANVVTYVMVCDPRKVMRADLGIALIDLDRSEA